MAPPKDAKSSASLSPPNTALQGHVAFFDTDNDGIIWPLDTYHGFRAIGFGVFLSFLSMLVIHFGFSYATCSSWIPDPFFRLYNKNMHRAVHGSDSRSYTHRGELDEARFDEIFNTYTYPPNNNITFKQGVRMIRGNANPFDPFGWFAAIFEWGATYILLGSPVLKEDVKGLMDGSLFYKLAAQKEKNAKKHKTK
ncbi:hypothetical protein M422DRAFT_209552 [Sphaerobolus stellatus SS14]|uniref:Caleosin-domain-containing protein n=1 Tax=Sphaerobolus stellatus (strain SS14) TaxID=990650 RepID=A0A0C9VSQ5_SPHS4|nr:hypothetical protein M422DRAFT_192531 [Sphaerobolus stellatus SS14]KIJ41101.1 hypothetical protein M422DRAFT_209552 [Sphaerobolus stellatus SS14]